MSRSTTSKLDALVKQVVERSTHWVGEWYNALVLFCFLYVALSILMKDALPIKKEL